MVKVMSPVKVEILTFHLVGERTTVLPLQRSIVSTTTGCFLKRTGLYPAVNQDSFQVAGIDAFKTIGLLFFFEAVIL